MKLTLIHTFLITLLLSVSFSFSKSFAQPTRPTLECISGDTLRWTNPTDACGPLNSIEVFGALDLTSNFTSLGNVQSPESFFALTKQQANDYKEFYLVATYACTPALSLPSDTVSSLPLPLTYITSIDYTTTGTNITWTAPKDKRVTQYFIYRETSTGTTLLDTVQGTSYTNTLTQVEAEGTIYYIASVDECFTSSFNSETYSSTRLDVDRDGCNGKLTIAHKLPAKWPRKLTRTQIIRTTPNGFSDTTNLSKVDSIVTLIDLPPDSLYNLSVTYFDEFGGSTRAFPSTINKQAVVSSDTIEVAQLSFFADNWNLLWRWKTNAKYRKAQWQITRGNNMVTSGNIDSAFADVPTPALDITIPNNVNWATDVLTISATDACNVERKTTPVKPTLIKLVEQNTREVGISWDLPISQEVTFSDWKLVNIKNQNLTTLFSSTTEKNYVHDVTEEINRQVCYQIVAKGRVTGNPSRSNLPVTWRSPISCINRKPSVFLPTGFKPEGFTIVYKPVTALIEGLDYKFEIFDRWGKVIFSTNDPFEGWEPLTINKDYGPSTLLARVILTEKNGEKFVYETPFTIIR